MWNFLFGCFVRSDRLMARTRAQAFSSRKGIHLDSWYVNAIDPPSSQNLHLLVSQRRPQQVRVRKPVAQMGQEPLGVADRSVAEVLGPLRPGPPHPVQV